MRERCWDFAIAKRLPVEDVYMAVAVRLLAHACAHHQEELRFCLNRSRPLFPTVAKRHNELFAEIELELSTGLPCTPALSQAEMARASASVTTRFAATCVPVIGGPSRPMPSSTGTYRRWRHVTAAKQAERAQTYSPPVPPDSLVESAGRERTPSRRRPNLVKTSPRKMELGEKFTRFEPTW